MAVRWSADVSPSDTTGFASEARPDWWCSGAARRPLTRLSAALIRAPDAGARARCGCRELDQRTTAPEAPRAIRRRDQHRPDGQRETATRARETDHQRSPTLNKRRPTRGPSRSSLTSQANDENRHPQKLPPAGFPSIGVYPNPPTSKRRTVPWSPTSRARL
jgi:hypothetical protein